MNAPFIRTVASTLALACAGCGSSASRGDGGGAAADGASGSAARDGGGDDGGGGARSRATLRVHYPAGAHEIAIRGDGGGLDWQQGAPAKDVGGDTWQLDVAITAPLAWKPLLDDATWSRGMNYTVAPGETLDVYPHFTATKGQVVALFSPFHSDALGNDRIVWAYLPPSYDENPYATYPVLYMHDGQNLFDPALAFGGHEWMVDETLDAGIDALDLVSSLREVIVVGPENTADRVDEYTPTYDATEMAGGRGDLYLRMLVSELKPRVDATLRTRPGRDTTTMMGSSLGGLISAYAGCVRADVFGGIGALSPSTWWDGDVIIADVMKAGHASARVYVDSGDSGTDDDDVTDTRMLANEYLAVGYQQGVDFDYLVQAGGQHSEIYWAERLPGALRFLVGPQAP